jgi:4-diphosphocytidyl-2-C-methyl-D-erythritol kinase
VTARVPAPAKITLDLRVGPPTADGFHPIRSWFRTVDLADELQGASAESMSLSCNDVDVPTGEANLAWRAAALVGPMALVLTKRIPAGGGLGGGSSDAAAALVLADRAHRRNVPRGTLSEHAARLGSDVPFFLAHQLDGITDATCTGRGEIVTPFDPVRRLAVLLILPGLHVPTPAVFTRFDEMPMPAAEKPDYRAWSALRADDLLGRLRNDLEPPAFDLYPALARLRDACEARLGRPVRLTGSGSTLFTLYDTPDQARQARAHLDVSSVVA